MSNYQHSHNPEQEIVIIVDLAVLYSEPGIYSPEEHLVFGGLQDFVKGRLMPLKDEILREQRFDRDKKITITLMREEAFLIMNYSRSLSKKIKRSFTQQDIDFIMGRVHNGLMSICRR